MKTLIISKPRQETDSLRHQLNKQLQDLQNRRKAQEMAWTPAMEMQTTSDAVILRLEVPGIEGKDLEVQVTREAVLISGDRPSNKTKGRWPSEIRYGKFRRLIPLPVPVENNQVQTEFNNGILTLTLPKLAAVRRSVVKVKVSSDDSTREIASAQPRKTEVAPAAEKEPDDLQTDLWAA